MKLFRWSKSDVRWGKKPPGVQLRPPTPTARNFEIPMITNLVDPPWPDAKEDLEAEGARLRSEIAANERKLAELEEQLDKILYLPAGRVRNCNVPELDFVVDATTAEQLNTFAFTISEKGFTPWLDVMHDRKRRAFSIAHFKFESEGVVAYGRYSELGRYLRDAGRISGVSITAPVARWNNKPVCAAFDCEISSQAAPRREPVPATIENLAILGAILVDGCISAIQPYQTPTEQWLAILEQLGRNQQLCNRKPTRMNLNEMSVADAISIPMATIEEQIQGVAEERASARAVHDVGRVQTLDRALDELKRFYIWRKQRESDEKGSQDKN